MVRELAEAGRLRFNLDDCRDPVIPGKFGHIYEYSDAQMGVCLVHPVESKRTGRFMRNRMRVLSDLGLVVRQTSDSEGAWLLPIGFDHKHPQYAIILRAVGIRKIRRAGGRPFERKP